MLETARRPARVTVAVAQHGAPLAMIAIPVRVRVFMQKTADHRLRFVVLRDLDALNPGVQSEPGVGADEIDAVRPQEQELRHDGVVVVGFRQVAVGAGLGFGFARRVREVRRERLTREAARRDRGLGNVDPFSVAVLV